MTDTISKYFSGELTPKETELFLLEISGNENLGKEFIEIQQLIACINLLPRQRDGEKARERLLHFMQ